MASYRLSVKPITRSAGRSAVAAAAYRAGERLTDQRTGEVHDYERRGGVIAAEIMLPDNAPDSFQDREQLWSAAELAEKRSNSRVAREIQLSLPHELSEQQRQELVREFVQNQITSRGMVADIAYHAPGKDGDDRNFHAHILVPTRDVSERGFEGKNRDWNKKEVVNDWRETWANMQNRHLEQALGQGAPRVTHRSFHDRGLDIRPTVHLGPASAARERSGKTTERGNYNRRSMQEREELRNHRTRSRAIQRVAAPSSERSIEGVITELRMRAAQQSERLKELRSKIENARDKQREQRRESYKSVRAEIFGDSYWRMKRSEKEARFAQSKASPSSIKSELLFARYSPAKYLALKAKRALDAITAANKFEVARLEYASKKAFMQSKEGKEYVTSRVESQRDGDLNWRSEERKLRRHFAKATREGSDIEAAFKRAEQLRDAGIVSIKAANHKLDDRAYFDELRDDILRSVKSMTPDQWQKVRQTQKRAERDTGQER